MRLVGASTLYIALPFLLEALVTAVVGVALAAGALVAFEQFGRAAIYKMLGKSGFQKPRIQAVLDEPIHNFDGRRVFARAIVTKENGTYHARLTGNQSSNLLTSMARANGLAICPEDMPVKEAGEVVEVQMLDWPEEVF